MPWHPEGIDHCTSCPISPNSDWQVVPLAPTQIDKLSHLPQLRLTSCPTSRVNKYFVLTYRIHRGFILSFRYIVQLLLYVRISIILHLWTVHRTRSFSEYDRELVNVFWYKVREWAVAYHCYKVTQGFGNYVNTFIKSDTTASGASKWKQHLCDMIHTQLFQECLCVLCNVP